MSPEAQRIAIAEACGWTDCRWHTWTVGPRILAGTDLSGRTQSIPEYTDDLNAMHEAEKTLNHAGPEWQTYKAQIWARGPHDNTHATAAQRAEAFLRTVGKWTE